MSTQDQMEIGREDYLRRRNRRKVHRGKAVPWFERFGGDGVAAIHGRMAADRLR